MTRGAQHMTISTGTRPALYWRPGYLRRAPRWHDGVGRLLDLGGTFDLRLPDEDVAEALVEDYRVAVDELRRAWDEVQRQDA